MAQRDSFQTLVQNPAAPLFFTAGYFVVGAIWLVVAALGLSAPKDPRIFLSEVSLGWLLLFFSTPLLYLLLAAYQRHIGQQAETSSLDLHRVLEGIEHCIAIFGADGRCRYANPAALRALEYSPETLLSKNLKTIFSELHPVDFGKTEPSGHGLCERRGKIELASGVRKSVWLRFYDLSHGQLAVVFSEGSSSKINADAVTGVKFQSLIDNASDGVEVLDPEGVIKYASPATTRLTGFSPDEKVGHHIREFIHPDDIEYASLALARLTEDPAIEEVVQVRIRNKRGGWRWIECTGSNRLGDREISGIIVNFRDITERKLAEEALRANEERYRKLINYSSDALVLYTADGKAMYASAAIKRVTGYLPREFASLTSIFSLVHEDELPTVQKLFREITNVEGKGLHATFRLRNKHNEWIWIECVATNWLQETGIKALVFNFRDVTRRVELEQAIQHSAKMEAVGRLAGGVAHDFNNVLVAITGYSQLLVKNLEHNPVARRQAELIVSAANRAGEITRQLLALSRKQEVRPRILDINDSIRKMSNLVQHLIGEQVRLIINLAPDIKRIRCDPGQLDQIVMNLSVNARDAMPSGGDLEIETRNIDILPSFPQTRLNIMPGSYVLLTVRDTGIGMDSETRKRLFEPFFSTKDQAGGTGLGLATVYGIVKKWGGYIDVLSQPHQGTCFKIYFPTTVEPDEIPEKHSEIATRGGDETVLIAEDDDIVREFVSDSLNGAGYRVIAAPSGEIALKEFENAKGKVQLLLTDVVMPSMNGFALAERLEKRDAGIKTIFMSGYSDRANYYRQRTPKDINFIQKPFSHGLLLRRVREALDGRKY